ncbi:MAG: sensor histidine kinase [Spirochaeta sp.]|jgi:signal transduction histidine kinase|nr:sensor histidine kinase [Spirochaeta sp.]
MNGFPRGPLVTVLFLYLTAIVLYQIAPADTVTQEFWEVWSTQVTALLLVSLIAGAVALRIRTGPIRATIVGAQIAIFALGVYGEAAFSIALFAWGAALIVQTFVLVSYRTAIVLSTVMIATAIFLPRADTVWNVAVADRQAVDIVAGLTFFGLVLYLTATSTASMRRAEEYLQSREQLRDSLLQLTTANVGFQNYAVAAEKRGTEEERQRITREIHDTVGYTLTNIIMMTKASEELIDRDHQTLRNLLGEARGQCQDALVETRRTLRQLRSIQTPEVDFPNQVWKTVHTFEIATGIDVQLEFRNLPPVRNTDVRSVLHRTVQEGLTNAFRHGQATHVAVLFWYDGTGISVIVRDNGVGNPSFHEDIGIHGMRERFAPLGGVVHAESLAGGGFEVRGWVPN